MALADGRIDKVCAQEIEISGAVSSEEAMAKACNFITNDIAGAKAQWKNPELKSVSHQFIARNGRTYLTVMYVVECNK